MKKIFFLLSFLLVVVTQSIFATKITIINATKDFQGFLTAIVKGSGHIKIYHEGSEDGQPSIEKGKSITYDSTKKWHIYTLTVEYITTSPRFEKIMEVGADLGQLKISSRNENVKVYAYDDYKLGIDKGDGKIIPLPVKLSTDVPEEV